jgi:hypothetical protein
MHMLWLLVLTWGFLASQVSCFDATQLLTQLPECAVRYSLSLYLPKVNGAAS